MSGTRMSQTNAMNRRYNRWWSRFEQPDPYDGSYDATDPQSLNRYAYVQNDPANVVDPSGLNPASPGTSFGGSFWVSWKATGHFIGDVLQYLTDFRYTISPMPGSGSGESGAGGGIHEAGHTPQNPTPFTREETNSLRDALKDTLKGKCADFLNAFSKRISTSTNSARNLMDVFNDVSQQGGFFHVYRGLGFALGDIHGSPGDARIGLSTSFDAVTRVLITIHELFHHGGTSQGFNHNVMGTAAWDVGQEQGLLDGLKNTNTPGPPRRGNDDVSTNYNATLFDNIVRAACAQK
jgi:RHS repeat-associated protein